MQIDMKPHAAGNRGRDAAEDADPGRAALAPVPAAPAALPVRGHAAGHLPGASQGALHICGGKRLRTGDQHGVGRCGGLQAVGLCTALLILPQA